MVAACIHGCTAIYVCPNAPLCTTPYMCCMCGACRAAHLGGIICGAFIDLPAVALHLDRSSNPNISLLRRPGPAPFEIALHL